MNTTGNMINDDICNNLVSITCSTSISENCFVNATNIESPVIVAPGDTYHIIFDKTPQDVEITIHINSTILVHNFAFSRSKYAYLIFIMKFMLMYYPQNMRIYLQEMKGSSNILMLLFMHYCSLVAF